MEIQIQQDDGTVTDCEYEYKDVGGIVYWLSKYVDYSNGTRVVNYPCFTGKVRPKKNVK